MPPTKRNSRKTEFVLDLQLCCNIVEERRKIVHCVIEGEGDQLVKEKEKVSEGKLQLVR